jgi:hypothetical protein
MRQESNKIRNLSKVPHIQVFPRASLKATESRLSIDERPVVMDPSVLQQLLRRNNFRIICVILETSSWYVSCCV